VSRTTKCTKWQYIPLCLAKHHPVMPCIAFTVATNGSCFTGIMCTLTWANFLVSTVKTKLIFCCHTSASNVWVYSIIYLRDMLALTCLYMGGYPWNFGKGRLWTIEELVKCWKWSRTYSGCWILVVVKCCLAATTLQTLGFSWHVATWLICGCTGTTVNTVLTYFTCINLLLAGNDTVPISMWMGAVCAVPSVL